MAFDDTYFDPATYAPLPGMLSQMFATPMQGGAPPPGWAPGMAPPMDVPPPPGGIPPGPMSSGDGGALMPVPPMPQPSPMAGSYAQADAGAEPPPIPNSSMLGRSAADLMARLAAVESPEPASAKAPEKAKKGPAAA
jgi:hypothetical protein